MSTFLVILHILGAIIFLGPLASAVLCFPVYAARIKKGDLAQGASSPQCAAGEVLTFLGRMTETFGLLSLLVPLLGFGIFFDDVKGYSSEPLVWVAIVLACIAWCVLFAFILPRQRSLRLFLRPDDDDEKTEKTSPRTIDSWPTKVRQLSIFGWVFTLLWMITCVLMFFL